MPSTAVRYRVLKDYGPAADQAPADPQQLSRSAAWAFAILRLGRPVTYSRRTKRSIGTPVEGAATRTPGWLVVRNAASMEVSADKASHTPTFNATVASTSTNFLDPDVCLDGDWVLAWMCASQEELDDVLARLVRGEPANRTLDGLRFVGRLHSVRKRVAMDDVFRHVSFQFQAIGFEELDTSFFYDFALATSAVVHNEISTFLAQFGLDFSKWAEQEQLRAGDLKDNADILIPLMIDAILGKGISDRVNAPIQDEVAKLGDVPDRGRILQTQDLLVAPQADKSAPYAYLVPREVGVALGREPAEASKAQGVFGYADLLDTLIGVQKYHPRSGSLYPELDTSRSTASRHYTTEKLKGTFLPVEPSFVNVPLWRLLQQFLNPTLNEMYVALKPDPTGHVVPTLVCRQIPFTTESYEADESLPVTRFLELPRWWIEPVLVSSLDIGRSNATRINMIHVYGEATTWAANMSVTDQMVLNPPIFDRVDIHRSGMRPLMETVACALGDQFRPDGARIWMELIADRLMGSQFTLNGQIETALIPAPIAPGDNVEFQGVVYHVEGVRHACSLSADGRTRSGRTSLNLSNGMPADQSGATADFPRYAGFKNEEHPATFGPETDTSGDPDVATELDPGGSKESR